MLWRALPVIENLQTAWEAKYAMYHDAINDGLEKLKKYYSHFDQKPIYILALGEWAFELSIWNWQQEP